MDLQNEEGETEMRRISKCVGFHMPTKAASLMEAGAPRLPPDPARLLSSSRRRWLIGRKQRTEGKEPAIKVGRGRTKR